MHINEIRAIAKRWQLPTGSRSKTELVRAIQREEGNFDCFATAYDGICDQIHCLWRSDCFTLAKRK